MKAIDISDPTHVAKLSDTAVLIGYIDILKYGDHMPTTMQDRYEKIVREQPKERSDG